MTHVDVLQGRVHCGIATREITPPVGIYCRMWGAARHDRAASVHRPLRATAVHLSPSDSSDHGLMIVTLDHCLLGVPEMDSLIERLASAAELPRENVLVLFSHTHAAGLMSAERCNLPGGEMIEPYLEQLATAACEAIREAMNAAQPAHIVYGVGKCALAVQRDFEDRDSEQYVCGYNPEGVADDTVVVGRITGEHGTLLGTLVNYACHPTTLAWENDAISPDFPGAMRELIEEATGAPCVFLQGASGDLAPKEQYVGDLEVADRNGRQLGYAALSVLAGLPPAGTQFEYAGPVVSGATLGVWKYRDISHSDRADSIARWKLQRSLVPLPYRSDLPAVEQVRQDFAKWEADERQAEQAGDSQQAADCRAMAERSRRLMRVLEHLPPDEQFPMPVTILRTGDAVWVAVEAEHYQQLQTELRNRFPDRMILVATLANGSRARYLVPADTYGRGIYQETIALLEAGALETLIDEIGRRIDDL